MKKSTIIILAVLAVEASVAAVPAVVFENMYKQ